MSSKSGSPRRNARTAPLRGEDSEKEKVLPRLARRRKKVSLPGNGGKLLPWLAPVERRSFFGGRKNSPFMTAPGGPPFVFQKGTFGGRERRKKKKQESLLYLGSLRCRGGEGGPTLAEG